MACNYDADIRQRKFQNSEKHLPSLSDSFLFYDIHSSSSSDEISSKKCRMNEIPKLKMNLCFVYIRDYFFFYGK